MTKYVLLLVAVSSLILLNNHFFFFAFNIHGTLNEGPIRIMTYNSNGVHGDYKDSIFLQDFLITIDSIKPQILALQEMHKHYSNKLCDELQNRYLFNSLSELEKQKYEEKRVACFFSSYPIKSFFRYKYKMENIDSIYKVFNVPDSVKRPKNADIYNAVLDIHGHETLIICCHLKSNDYSRFRYEHSNNWFEGLNEYFNGYYFGSEVRLLNAKMIRDSIAKYDLPTIVCGDMNDFQCSPTLQTIMGDDLKNVWWERGIGYGMTYNKYQLKVRIDHILISDELKAESVAVPHLRFSDHYPVVADLRYNSN